MVCVRSTYVAIRAAGQSVCGLLVFNGVENQAERPTGVSRLSRIEIHVFYDEGRSSVKAAMAIARAA